MKPCRLNTHKGCRIFLSFELPANNKKKHDKITHFHKKTASHPYYHYYFIYHFISFFSMRGGGGVDDAANMCIIIGQYSPPFFIILFQLKTFPLFELHA